jgi:hypothetical protein
VRPFSKFLKKCFGLIFYFFREVPKGLTTKYRKSYARAAHTSVLKILPNSAMARHLWWDLAYLTVAP